jgi:uncharacterized repeat protein (TIGR01451 family)
LVLGLLIVMLIGYSGGASAAPGPTDLSITKTDSPDPVVQGGNLTYTIRVTNNGAGGTADATGVVVTDNLPSSSDIDYVSASSTAGTCQKTGNTVTCNLGTVTAGTTQTVTIVVKAKKTGTLSNTATVASPEDNTPANNSATAATTVVKAKVPKGPPSCAAPTITGTAGNDVITGTSRGDVIVTYSGNDQVYAGGGKDLVCSGDGADLVLGQDGGDTVIAGGGPDRAVGGKSGDTLKGKAGRDVLKGKSGDDFLNGGRNRDRCRARARADLLATLVFGVLLIAVNRPLLHHHLVILAWPLALVAASTLPTRLPARAAAAAALGCLLLVPWAVRGRDTVQGAESARINSAAAVVRQETDPDQTVVSDLPLVPLAAGREAAAETVDPSAVRIATGSLDQREILTASEGAGAIVVGRAFTFIPGLCRELKRRFGAPILVDGIRIYLVQRGPV